MEGGVACSIRKSLSCSQNPNFCEETKSLFIDIFLLKSKPIFVALLHQPQNKPKFIEHLVNYLKENNICNIQKCYLTADFTVNLLSGKKMLLKKSVLTPTPMLYPQLKDILTCAFSTPSIK